MDIRKRIFVIIGIVVGVILAAILAYLVISDRAPDDDVVDDVIDIEQDTVQIERDVPEPIFEALPQPAKFGADELAARQLARDFVERFASYSNQNNNSHIQDVLPLTTAKVSEWLLTQDIFESDDYQGVTTRVIAMAIQSIDEESAIVKVDTQQNIEELRKQEVSYRSGRVELVKVDGVWKVDGFYWE